MDKGLTEMALKKWAKQAVFYIFRQKKKFCEELAR